MLNARAFARWRPPQTTCARFPPLWGNTLTLQLSQRMKTDKKLSLVSCRALTTPAVPAAAPLRAAARTERWPPLHLLRGASAGKVPRRATAGQQRPKFRGGQRECQRRSVANEATPELP